MYIHTHLWKHLLIYVYKLNQTYLYVKNEYDKNSIFDIIV